MSKMNHMREHPEDREWLKTHVRPRLWKKFGRNEYVQASWFLLYRPWESR